MTTGRREESNNYCYSVKNVDFFALEDANKENFIEQRLHFMNIYLVIYYCDSFEK